MMQNNSSWFVCFVTGFNAGLAAYRTWVNTLLLLKVKTVSIPSCDITLVPTKLNRLTLTNCSIVHPPLTSTNFSVLIVKNELGGGGGQGCQLNQIKFTDKYLISPTFLRTNAFFTDISILCKLFEL